ncbi:MAG: UbiA family prenyltransferase [Candidatus Thermoplasmatota archaeon]|nr:UbiA family prenyltransferase [Candidatus Thermoplasmatota archaeon]MBS3801644.1 UbiA family prenyltransferase [Candidatus Thermoplasmatota archaeon]
MSTQSNNIPIKTKLFAHLETMRPYTVIWCGLVSFAGACLSWGQLPPIDVAILSLIVPIMGWIAGLYLSDFLDRNLDKIEKPHRPIPSGRIKPYEAILVGSIYAIVGTFFSWYLGIRNFSLVFIVALLVLTYTSIAKSRGFLGHINRGIVTVAAYLYGVFTSPLSLEAIPMYILLLTPVFLFHDVNSNLVGAIRDMEGDKKGGYQTIPVKYGIKKSIALSILLTCIWFPIAFIIPLQYDFVTNYYYYLILIDVIILLSFYIFFFWSLKSYSRKKALKYHEFFVIERITLASAFIIGSTTIILGIGIYLTALILTSLFQISLRSRYEFQDGKLS